MKKLRVDQRKEEPADIWLLRCLGVAWPHMNQNQKWALSNWMQNRTRWEILHTSEPQDRSST